jgi:hypothetical protein
MQRYIRVVFMFLIWNSVWGIFTILKSLGLSESEDIWLVGLYFLSVTAVFIYAYKSEKNFFFKIPSNDYLVFSFILLLGPVSYYLIRNYILVDLSVLADADQLVKLDYLYLFSVGFNICFQQALFYFAAKDLFPNLEPTGKNAVKYSLLLAFLHVTAFLVSSWAISVILILASFVAGIIFYYFISRYKGAFLKNFSIHYLFYAIFPIIYWLINK